MTHDYAQGASDARRALRCWPPEKAVRFAAEYFDGDAALTPANVEFMRGMTDTLLVLVQVTL